MIGKTLGHYEISTRIGEGGMVWVAEGVASYLSFFTVASIRHNSPCD